MKKTWMKAAVLTLAMSAMSVTAAFAGEWGKVGQRYFYYQEDGTVAKNQWIASADGTGEYWVGVDGVMAAGQWVNTDDAWYYVGEDGLRLTNQMFKQNSELYWLGEDGKMAVNEWVQTEDGKWYYMQANGRAIKNGWKLIDGDYYYFLKNGVMAADALVPGGYRVGADGKWVQN